MNAIKTAQKQVYFPVDQRGLPTGRSHGSPAELRAAHPEQKDILALRIDSAQGETYVNKANCYLEAAEQTGQQRDRGLGHLAGLALGAALLATPLFPLGIAIGIVSGAQVIGDVREVVQAERKEESLAQSLLQGNEAHTDVGFILADGRFRG